MAAAQASGPGLAERGRSWRSEADFGSGQLGVPQQRLDEPDACTVLMRGLPEQTTRYRFLLRFTYLGGFFQFKRGYEQPTDSIPIAHEQDTNRIRNCSVLVRLLALTLTPDHVARTNPAASPNRTHTRVRLQFQISIPSI